MTVREHERVSRPCSRPGLSVEEPERTLLHCGTDDFGATGRQRCSPGRRGRHRRDLEAWVSS